MSWQPEIDELRRREALAEQMGGEERVARQRSFGKMTVRDRVDALIDPGSCTRWARSPAPRPMAKTARWRDFRPANMVFGRAQDRRAAGGGAGRRLHRARRRGGRLHRAQDDAGRGRRRWSGGCR